MNKISKLVLTFALIVIVSFGAWFAYQLFQFSQTPLNFKSKQSIHFVFHSGESTKNLAVRLKELDVIGDTFLFMMLARLNGYSKILKAGEYEFMPGVTSRQLLKKMVSGDFIKHNFTIVEGWTFRQVIDAVLNNKYLKHTIAGLSNHEVMEKIGHSGEEPEGKFYPDTYLFSVGYVDIDILRAAYNLMEKRLYSEWLDRSSDFYQCSYQSLIVASMIEKETAISSEKPIIVGIVISRLKKGMPLQIDPTVIYGLGNKFKGRLTKANLRKYTSYNTYLKRGLPPTPISMPGLDSIKAAMNPVNTKFLYYVAKKDGTHVFSKTLSQQNAAIKKHLLHS